jgi:hypothetical protein
VIMHAKKIANTTLLLPLGYKATPSSNIKTSKSLRK